MSFARTRKVQAGRKAYICAECGMAIAIGEPHLSTAQMVEGEFMADRHHAECSAWAHSVMAHDDGRAWLCEGDPADEWRDDFVPAVRANPPSDTVYFRLPPVWRAAVDRILGPRPWPRQERLL